MNKFISASDISAFLNCRQAWDFSSPLRQALAPKLQQKSLQLGTLVHSLLEYYYGILQTPTIKEVGAYLQQLVSTEAIRLKGTELSELDFENALQQTAANAVLAADIVSNYIRWSKENDTDLLVLDTEMSFNVPLPNADVDVLGIMDTVFRSKSTDAIWVNDFKTCGTVFDTMANYLSLYSLQARLYVWALHKLYPNEKVGGMIFTIIKNTPPRKPTLLKNGQLSRDKNQLTTWVAYKDAVIINELDLNDYMDMKQVLQHNEFVRRITIRIDDNELQQFERNMIIVAKSMVNSEIDIYPSPSFFGCQHCAYANPCRAVQTCNTAALSNYLSNGFGKSAYADRKIKLQSEMITNA